jgi:hypothetical protein
LVCVLYAAPLFALWIAMTDNTRPIELLVGAGCSLLAGLGCEAAGLFGRVGFRPRARWLLRAGALPWWIVRDGALVLVALVTRRRGRFMTVPFPTGGDDARAQARRAIAFGAGSAGPNTYAIGCDEDVLVVHQLVPSDDVTPARVVEES